MIIPFENISCEDFAVSGINAVYQKPTYRSLLSKNRLSNGFLFIIKGECVYKSESGVIRLSPGSVIYLPSGSKHRMEVVSDDIEFFRVDFTVKVGDELVLFSKGPLEITSEFSDECLNCLKELQSACFYGNNSVLKMQKLLSVFSELDKKSLLHSGKLKNAIIYLEQNFTSAVDCHALAKLCFLSTSQFYNLFKKQFGCSPLQYRDRLLTEKAKSLLSTEEITVSEVAEILGFFDVAYFSRYFKKHVGVTPSQFANKI